MCFGPVVSDGYGVCYNPMNDHINFAVSSFNTCEETNVVHLARAIMDALLDMRTLLEQSPRAKLWSAQRRTGVSHCPEDSTVIVIIKVSKVTDWCWHIAHAWNKMTIVAAIGNICFIFTNFCHALFYSAWRLIYTFSERAALNIYSWISLKCILLNFCP